MRDLSSHNTKRLAQGHIHPIRPHRDRVALHFSHKTGEKLHLGRRDGRVAAHLGIWVAAIGRVHHRKLISALVQESRDFLQNTGTLKRSNITPFLQTRRRYVHLGPGRRSH